MATTTTKLIREQQQALLRALTPARQSAVAFREYELEHPFREWCEANPNASFRQVYIEDLATYETPLGGNTESEELETTFLVEVAYPEDHRYGLSNKADAMDLITEDLHQIDTAIGHRGYGNYVSGQNAAIADSKEIDDGEGVRFLSMQYRVNFRRAF